jgi:hypothetical protein
MEKEEEKEKFSRKIIKDIEQHLGTGPKGDNPEPSKVSRNKNNKTISVSQNFDVGRRIPIKIIASEKVWIKLEKKCFENDFDIEFEDIRPYLKASAKNIVKLERYSKEFPEDFIEHFYHYYIEPSKDKNTLVTKKPRGGSPYGLARSKMWEIKIIARHIYILLHHWLKQPQGQWPSWLTEFLKRHDISTTDIILHGAVSATRELIESRFKKGMGKQDEKNFYERYIVFQDLEHLKKAYQNTQYQPFRKLIKDFFQQ